MLKALIKKQLMELAQSMSGGSKKKVTSSAVGSLGNAPMILLLFFGLGAAFWFVSGKLLTALSPVGELGISLYYTLITSIAMLLGVFGSVFNTYASLYLARDNEALLSMPIPPHKILTARAVGVFVMGLFYTGVVWLPGVGCHLYQTGFSVLPVARGVLVWLLIALFATAITCVLGWIVAMIAVKLRGKTFIKVLLAVVLFGAYYFICFRSDKLMTSLAENAAATLGFTGKWLYPLYKASLAAQGDVPSLGIFAAIAFGAALVCLFVLSRTFLWATTTKKGGKKAVYKGQNARVRSLSAALISRERMRFTANSTYVLNCGLGLLLMCLLCVPAVLKKAVIAEVISQLPAEFVAVVPAVVAAATCFLSSFVMITAPSVSLEGKAIASLHALPVSARAILNAKLRFHWRLSLPVTFVCTAVLGWALGEDAVGMALACLESLSFAFMMAPLGLFFNLRHVNLDWTSEAQPVKQSMAVFLTMIAGFVLSVVPAVLLFVMMPVSGVIFICATAAIYLVIALACLLYIRTRGARKFEEL